MKSQILNKKKNIRKWLKNKPVGQAFQPAIKYGTLKPLRRAELSFVQKYKRRLPHWEKAGSTYFVTFRVKKTLGKPLIKNPILADVVEEALWFGYGDRYILEAYVIMPDHVHLLLTPLFDWDLSKILQGIKGYTSKNINKLLNRKGSFWQDESFDHLVRNEVGWLEKFYYIHHNPVKAGLVDMPEDYEYSSLVTIHSKGRLESLPHRIREKYEFIDHTADFGIRVFGSDSQELFSNAAWALFDVLTETEALTGNDSCMITVSGEDWSDLMVNWLREVLFLWNGRERLVKSVQILSLSEKKISAKIFFDAYIPDRHIIKIEIKAVTYHQIYVKSGPSGWEAGVIFDI